MNYLEAWPSSTNVYRYGLQHIMRDKKCYYPHGGEIPADQDHVPCNPTSAGHSACCRSDAVCLTHGLCCQQDSCGNRLGRCGCTDSSWKDGSCAQVCADGESSASLKHLYADTQGSTQAEGSLDLPGGTGVDRWRVLLRWDV